MLHLIQMAYLIILSAIVASIITLEILLLNAEQ